MNQITLRQRACRFGLLCVVMAAASCRTTPMTGRKQLLLVPETQEVAMGISAYSEVLAESTPSTHPQYTAMVNRVGQRIARVANRPDYQWEFRVIASPEQNAFALPGGKVAVYEGILPICVNEAGVAVVMAHEVAHALARHGGERMSQSVVIHGVKSTAGYLMRNQDKVKRDRVLQAYGVASKYGVTLPYSRKHELEADHMGLMLMAKAGYDPREAPRFWERFAASHHGQSPPEFLSTHPTDERRVVELQDLLAEAMTQYEQAPEKLGLGQPLALSSGRQFAQPGPSPSQSALPLSQPTPPPTPRDMVLPAGLSDRQQPSPR